jgi:hypothetical protein
MASNILARAAGQPALSRLAWRDDRCRLAQPFIFFGLFESGKAVEAVEAAAESAPVAA